MRIVTHLLSFEARLRRAQGLAPDAALFILKEGRGRYSTGNNRKSDDRNGYDWKSQVICQGCGVKGHIKAKCRSKHKWASYEKSKSEASLASTASTSTAEFESESFLFTVILSDPAWVILSDRASVRHSDPVLVIHSDPVLDSTPDSVVTVNVASANRSADYWILDTGAINHVTGNRHLFETFHPMAMGEHEVKTANNSVVDAEGSGTITFYVNRPNAKPAQIVLQHVLYLPACGRNNLLSIVQLMRKGANCDFKLDGAMV